MYRILAEKDNLALRKTARDVPHSDISGKRIKKLIAEMKALLAKEEFGVALAAPQVGESLRIFIVSGQAVGRNSRNSPDESRQPQAKQKSNEMTSHRIELPDQVYINPIMTKVSRTKKDKHEGCLSIRGKWGIVPRSEKATVRAYDEHGMPFTRGASGFLAHVFQHEMDHLEGILYTDKATKLYDEKPAGEK